MGKSVKHILISFVIFMSLPVTLIADVAPDPGYKRITLNLLIESQDVFPDHRFFIKSGADLKEIEIIKGKTAVIEPLGGGAFYRAGTFLAVPKKSLTGLSESQTTGDLNEMQKAIFDGKVPGTLELIRHSFSREVSIIDAWSWKDPVYRIELDPQAGIRALRISGGASEGSADNKTSSGLTFWRSVAAVVVAGIFLAFGALMIGVWYFRRSSKVV